MGMEYIPETVGIMINALDYIIGLLVRYLGQ